MNNRDGSKGYVGIGTAGASSDSVPIPAPGIGTRISELLDRLGPRTDAAKVIGVSVATLQRYIREENMPPFDAAARLCAAAGASMEWLATGEGPRRVAGVREPGAVYGASQDLSGADLSIALELTEEVLRGKWLPKREYAEVVAGIYAMLTQGLPYAEILELARPTLKQGTKDGSRSAGDQSRDDADRRGSGEAGNG